MPEVSLISGRLRQSYQSTTAPLYRRLLKWSRSIRHHSDYVQGQSSKMCRFIISTYASFYRQNGWSRAMLLFVVVPAPTIEQRPAGSQGPGHFLDRAGVLLQETTLISFQTATAANNQHHVWRSTASQICRACFKPN